MKELQEFFRKQILSVVTYLQTTYILTCLLRTVWTIESVPRLISARCPAKSVTWYTTTLRCTNISQLVAHLFYPERSSVWHCFAVQSHQTEISTGTCSMVQTVCLNAYEHTSVCYTWIIFFISNDFWPLLSHSSLTKVCMK